MQYVTSLRTCKYDTNSVQEQLRWRQVNAGRLRKSVFYRSFAIYVLYVVSFDFYLTFWWKPYFFFFALCVAGSARP